MGPYRLDALVGRGGMGEVFRAFDPRLGRPVAVKRVRSDTGSGSAQQRLRREARAAAGLSHPSIVQVHDILQQDGDDWIVMEWVDGPSLRQLISSGPLRPAQVVTLGSDIADGLAAAHGRDILHRDLKTENVLLAPDGRAKILDFGLAKQLRSEDATQLTESGRLLGTCRAMSPEQARGFEVDGRSDLFSLGVLLYELATGTSPFRSHTIAETLVKVCSHAPPSVQTLNGEIPEELASLIEQLLEKAPQRRPGSAREASQELRRLQRDLDGSDDSLTVEGGLWASTETDLAAQATWYSETAVEIPQQGRVAVQDESVFGGAADSDSVTGSYADATRLLRRASARRGVLRGLGVLILGVLLVPAVQRHLVDATTERLVPVPAAAATMQPLLQMSELEPDGPNVSEVPRLVVLPFESLGPEENSYLAAGISEEITQRLAALGGLGVVSRTSARRAVKDGWTVQQIGHELDVDFLLEGMVNSPPVSEEDSLIRITLRLVRVADDTPIWTQSFDRLPNGLLKLQSEIAGGIAERLDVALRQTEEAALALALTTEPDAYFAYLRGLDYKNQPGYSEERMLRAVQMFQQAVDVDPGFVEALAELSQMHSYIYFNLDDSQERKLQALTALEAASDLDSQRWSVHMARAFYAYRVEGDYQMALQAFGEAARQTPHNTDVLQGVGYVRRRQGRLEDAAAMLIQAFSLDRGNATLAETIGHTLKDMRDFAAADAWFQRALQLAPDLPGTTSHRAFNNMNWKGCPDPLIPATPCATDGARAILESSPNRDHPSAYHAGLYLDLVDAAKRPEAEAAAILQRALERMEASRRFSRETHVSLSTFWHEVLLQDMAGLNESARRDVEQFRSQTEAALGRAEDGGLKQLDDDSTFAEQLQAVHLGLADAHLGSCERALPLGERATDLAQTDRYSGPTIRQFLALIYLKCGLREQALDQLVILLSTYGKTPLTITALALDPLWQELWAEPRFEQVLKAGQLSRD